MFNTADFLRQSSLGDFFRQSIFDDEDSEKESDLGSAQASSGYPSSTKGAAAAGGLRTPGTAPSSRRAIQ